MSVQGWGGESLQPSRSLQALSFPRDWPAGHVSAHETGVSAHFVYEEAEVLSLRFQSWLVVVKLGCCDPKKLKIADSGPPRPQRALGSSNADPQPSHLCS